MEQVIKVAIENGWEAYQPLEAYSAHCFKCEYCLDSLFWQALGKGLGWKETMHRLEYFMDGEEKYLYWKGDNGHQYTPHIVGWKYQMHRFIDHLAEGKDIDSFFNQLIK